MFYIKSYKWTTHSINLNTPRMNIWILHPFYLTDCQVQLSDLYTNNLT